MFTCFDRPARQRQGFSRRELLRVGGLGIAGLSLPNLLQARDPTAPSVLPTDKTFGRAKNVIFLYLAGGPPQHETFDPKPAAPADVRGPFQPISTNVPGIQFCELLPRTARIADKLAIVRSMSTDDNNHDSSGYWVLTGYKYVGPNSRTIQATDWPYFGSLVKRFKPSDILPPLSTVWIPDLNRLNENVTPAGQTGGIMGGEWDPDRFVGDPADPAYRVAGLRLSALARSQLARRQRLLADIESPFEAARRGTDVRLFDKFQQQAFDLLTSGKAEAAFAIHEEKPEVRERYGLNRWGQCVLLARRLVEAGVRLVHVQWPREPGDNAVDNPLWDTHAQNADRVEDVLCPQFDVGFTALVEDLDRRGLLDETLVVAIGEFGRTPKINGNGGRDHWGPVFSFALAGAGISGGQVYGASDKQGAYPAENRVQPGELTATIFHLLGLDSTSTFRDREGREHRLSEGKPLYKLLGLQAATEQRVDAGGDIARVPPFDPTITLRETTFATALPLPELSAPSRPKGWRGSPLLGQNAAGFGVRLRDGLAWMGLQPGENPATRRIEPAAMVVLAQEVRSPFAGTYRLRVRLRGDADSAELFEQYFRQPFSCKLQFFQYTESTKNAANRKELASIELKPKFNAGAKAEFETVELTKEFLNPNPGANFSFGLGLGVACVVEKTAAGPLELPAIVPAAGLVIEKFELEFMGKPRNDKVLV